MTTTASDDRDALKIRRREPDLIRAAGEGDLARVRKLLDAGVDPMAHHARTGQCALIEATRAGAYHCVRELVARITATEADAQARNAEERGAALSAPSPGAWKDRHNPHHKFEAQLEGALSAAANEGFHYCVEALLPALPTRRISVAQKAMQIAAYNGHTACVEVLLGVCRSYAPHDALAAAAGGGHPECVKLLMTIEGALDTSRSLITPLMLAASGESDECVRLLLPHSDPNAQGHDGQTALCLATTHECFRALLPHTDTALCDHDGNTALMVFSKAGNVECVRALLPRSDVAAKNEDGQTALDLAQNAACAEAIAADKATSADERRAALDRFCPTQSSVERRDRMPEAFALEERALLDVVAQSAMAIRSHASSQPDANAIRPVIEHGLVQAEAHTSPQSTSGANKMNETTSDVSLVPPPDLSDEPSLTAGRRRGLRL